MSNQEENTEEIATKPKLAENKDTKEKVGQKRNIKIGNAFSIIQEDDQEPILEEEKFLPITKMDKEKKKKLQEGKEGN